MNLLTSWLDSLVKIEWVVLSLAFMYNKPFGIVKCAHVSAEIPIPFALLASNHVQASQIQGRHTRKTTKIACTLSDAGLPFTVTNSSFYLAYVPTVYI